ncbi:MULTISPECIES: hypothetical protein [unclassified Gilliamella]|uniref:hypothetical protein n=1 Tax=unclassified Gilliamella TaxID=2685620 RepID=UPI00226AD3B9|nr:MULTISPECIES: hypothetical protein [unclassified Gilliamella]MCX8656531.1 hypothetical protein [Gilliamella sp. B2894]MCX8665960.1 hypothetical protein [Gilliamella sp. B2887]MCX8693157.1 hypothetical protein [Gilliamella sp. B2881]MCX8698284.1 hypothetical protein [Gilliamella sp. B3000]WDM18447.1 hypothetical protein J4T76_10110 [Gilliamella sp. B3022]
MTKLTQQEINELRKSFEIVICKQFDATYIEKDCNGNYVNDYVQNEWIKNINIFNLLSND